MNNSLSTSLSITCVGAFSILAGSCGLFSSKEDTGVGNVDKMQSAIEKVHVDCELAQQKVRDTTDLLLALIDGSYQGEPTEVYLRFVRSLEASEKHAAVLRVAVDDMKRTAKPVFETWQGDLLQITNPALRRQSEERLEQTMDRFNEVVAAARSSETGVDAFNQGARDISLFLGNDFNPAAMDAVAPEAQKLEDVSLDVDNRLVAAQTAVQDYMQASGLLGPSEFDESLPAAPGGAAPLETGSTGN